MTHPLQLLLHFLTSTVSNALSTRSPMSFKISSCVGPSFLGGGGGIVGGSGGGGGAVADQRRGRPAVMRKEMEMMMV